MKPSVLTTPELDSLLAAAPVAMGVSGGKDSCALGFAAVQYLEAIGHAGPRLLIHSDLGRIEWRDSLPTCERLARELGLELVVVRRQAGDMVDRWAKRWHDNVARYRDLLCVKVILPWSTASMRFCTSELKTAIICRDLVRRFPGQTIVSATGIRREESAKRRRAEVCKPQPRLANDKARTAGFDWNPILDWTREEVLVDLAARGFALHEAYTTYGSSRVSCSFCILASRADLAAAATCEANQDVYRELVTLEAESTFSFQERWLDDVAPHLLDGETKTALEEAKAKARVREELEAPIPDHLLYKKGWPKVMPTYQEAVTLGRIRERVGVILGIPVRYTDPDAIVGRYAELMDLNRQKAEAKARGEERRVRRAA